MTIPSALPVTAPPTPPAARDTAAIENLPTETVDSLLDQEAYTASLRVAHVQDQMLGVLLDVVA